MGARNWKRNTKKRAKKKREAYLENKPITVVTLHKRIRAKDVASIPGLMGQLAEVKSFG